MTTLLLPGTLCTGALWDAVRLPPDSHVLPAIRGQTLAAAAAHAMSALAGPVHLVGFSLGAIVAFEILRQWPERVRGVTLVSASPLPPTPEQVERWAEQRRAAGAGAFGHVTEQVAAGAGTHADAIRRMAQHLGPAVFLEHLALLCSRPDSRPTLAAYGGPLTVLVGADDPITPPRVATGMAALVPGGAVQVIPGAGHYLPLDAPWAVTDTVRGVAHA